MNDIRIRQYVDEIFNEVKPTLKVQEQKEELVVNITERVRDYIQEGLSFDAAFETAKNALGDTEELTGAFEKIPVLTGSQYPSEAVTIIEPDENPASASPRSRIHVDFGNKWTLTALSPFIYLMFGFLFGWWAWAWVIIPVSAILNTPMKSVLKLVALSPFIYILMGFFLGLWAWGWIIIPICGVLSTSSIKIKSD
jgi:hypothetical protein